jgi:hypothetical protein
VAKTEIITDDLDGTSPAQTVRVNLLGKVLEIDLDPEHCSELDNLLGRLDVFVAAGKLRRVRTPRPTVPPEP